MLDLKRQGWFSPIDFTEAVFEDVKDDFANFFSEHLPPPPPLSDNEVVVIDEQVLEDDVPQSSFLGERAGEESSFVFEKGVDNGESKGLLPDSQDQPRTEL